MWVSVNPGIALLTSFLMNSQEQILTKRGVCEITSTSPIVEPTARIQRALPSMPT